ncbi:MAG: peptidase domain-containing ABC transporter [Alphaproteobacteria bacterium]
MAETAITGTTTGATAKAGEAATRRADAGVLRLLRPALGEILVLSAFVSLLALTVPIFVLQVYDRVVAHAGLTTLQGLAVGMAAAILFDLILRQARSRVLQHNALKLDVRLGEQLFDKLDRLPLRTLESRPTAYWQSLFRDAEVVRNTIAGAPAVLLCELPFAFLFLGLVWVIAAPLVPVLLVAIFCFIVVALRAGAVMRRTAGSEREAGAVRDDLLGDLAVHRTTIKALSLTERLRERWAERQAETIEAGVLRGRASDGFGNLTHALGMATIVALTAYGALMIIDQQLSIGALVATNMLANRIIGPFGQLMSTWRSYVTGLDAARRLEAAFRLPEERSDATIEMPRPKGEITVDNISFAYRQDAAPVLRGVSLRLPAGGMNALVGGNGSGKSTLLKVIQGLYQPQAGRVLIDGADVAQFARRQIARFIGYVPQENVLLSGSIRDNIARGRTDVKDEAVIVAARQAGAHDFIVALPNGYATEIGESGLTLSGGQRQRIAIARALVGDPPVLLLDEPSASLDQAGEAHLRDTLRWLAADHTVLLVSHSPMLLEACDNVLVMDQGRLVRGGPSAQVIASLAQRRKEGA